jgi:hypothetical protein
MPFDIPHLRSTQGSGVKTTPHKAIAGFLAGAFVAFLGAHDGGVTGAEWLQVLVAGLGSSGLVYVIPNKVKVRKSR